MNVYAILVIDNHYISLYSIGEFAKTYGSIVEAEEEVKKLKELESIMFEDRNLTYQIVEVG